MTDAQTVNVSAAGEPDPGHRTKLLKLGTRQCRSIVSDDPHNRRLLRCPDARGLGLMRLAPAARVRSGAAIEGAS